MVHITRLQIYLQYYRKPDEDGAKIWAQMSEYNTDETSKYEHTYVVHAFDS